MIDGVDRSGYSDIMQGFENKLGELIVEEAQKWSDQSGLKKIEVYMVLENILAIMKDQIRNERNKNKS